MSTVSASDGDGLRPLNYDDSRVNQGQGGGDGQNVCTQDEPTADLFGAQPERRSSLQFTADYRRFWLDDALARRQQTSLVSYTANAQPSAPAQNGLSRADLEARAKRIFDRFQSDGFLGLSPATPYADIAAELNGLSAQDALQLRQIYQQKYSAQRGGRDLLADIAVEVSELQDRLRAFQILAPERVHPQTQPQSGFGDRAGIIADPPLDELVTGASAKYTFSEGAVIKAPNSGPFVRYLVQGPGGRVEALNGFSFDGHYDKPGVYRVTFEVTYRGQPPEYYTLKQVVRDPSDKAREALLGMPGTTVDPELFLHGVDAQIAIAEQSLADLRGRADTLRQRDWLSQPHQELERLDTQIRQLEDALDQLRQIKQDAPGKLFGGAAGPLIPLQATLIPTERPQPIPLQLYAKPLGGNRWAIVDMTSPTNARVFEGQAGATPEEGLRNAWREFVGANNLPAGQVAALPPAGMNFSRQEVWNDRSEGRSGFQQWASNLGWGSLALAAAGVVAAIVPGLEGFAPPLFIAAGLAGAGSGGLNIYDRARYGNFRWSSAETALDMLSIVGGFAGAGGGASALLRGGSAVVRTAEGASLTLRNLGKFTSITQGVDVGAGVASGVIIANVWLEQINRINNSNLPPEEKQRQVGAILQQAAMMGGIIVVGHGVSRFAPLVGEELNNLLRGARFEPELERLVRETPGLQRALQEQGADRLRRLYTEYKAGGGNTAGEIRAGSFLEYLAGGGAATRVGGAPLTQALGVSAESLSRMTPRELNESILRRTSPELLTALRRGDLPPDVQAALNDALNQDYKLAGATNFAAARRTLSEALNVKLGASLDNSPALRQALRSLAGEAVWPSSAEDQQAIREIAAYRQQSGLPAYQWRPGETGTVSYVEVGGQKVFGHNTTLERKYLGTDNRALREGALAEIQTRLGKLKGYKYGDWDVRFLTHAEAEALIKAHSQFGRLPERMTLYVDRITCNNCEEYLPLLAEAYGIKELRIVDAKGKQLVIRPGQPLEEIK